MREINLIKADLSQSQLSPPLVPVELQQVLSLLQGEGGDQPGPVLSTDSLDNLALYCTKYTQVLHSECS